MDRAATPDLPEKRAKSPVIGALRVKLFEGWLETDFGSAFAALDSLEAKTQFDALSNYLAQRVALEME